MAELPKRLIDLNMSRRKTKKNKRLNTKSKSEFVRSICKTCKLCDVTAKEVSGKDALSLFCYDFFYTYNPNSFLTAIYPATKRAGFWGHNVEEEVPTIDEVNEFQEIFCNSGVCHTSDINDATGECSAIDWCIGSFREFVVSPCEDDDDVDAEDFMANNWDGNRNWSADARLNKLAESHGIEKKGAKPNCPKRGKNKAQKKRDKKKNNKKKNKFSFITTKKVDQTPTATFFSNMTEEQIEHIYGGEHENKHKEQVKTVSSTD